MGTFVFPLKKSAVKFDCDRENCDFPPHTSFIESFIYLFPFNPLPTIIIVTYNEVLAALDSNEMTMAHLHLEGLGMANGLRIMTYEDFVAGIKDQKRQFEAGKETLDLSLLMILALKQYQTLIQDGIYNKPTTQEEHIIALTAKVEKQMNDRSKSNKVDAKTTKKKVKSFAAQPAKKTFDKPRVYRNEPAWMSKPPTDGRYVKQIEGVEWTFCRTHKK